MWACRASRCVHRFRLLQDLCMSGTRSVHIQCLVLISSAVFLSAEFAVGRRQAIVHAMFHRLQGAQISEHRFQIVISEVLRILQKA